MRQLINSLMVGAGSAHLGLDVAVVSVARPARRLSKWRVIGATQWIELSPLLDELLELQGDARAQKLAQIRRENAALAMQLETLLGERTAIERDAFLEGAAFSAITEPSLAGHTIGAYTLERPLGEGGMGAVWLGHRSDGRYEGKVAVKFLNLALLRARRGRALRARGQHAGAPDTPEHRAAVGCGCSYQCHGRWAALSRS